MIPLLALVRKDLRLFFSDRRAVIVGLVVPIVCGSFFGYLFGGQRKTNTAKMPILVIDQDDSAISHSVIAQLSGNKNLDVKPSSEDNARHLVSKGKITAAVVIPKNVGTDAGRAMFSGTTKPQIGMLYDPSHAMEVGMIQGILTGAVMQGVSKEMFSGESGRQMMKQSLVELENNRNIP